MVKTIAVDIDGVLTNETEGWDYPNRTPNKENIVIVNELLDKHTIMLFSARYECDRQDTVAWLDKHGVKHDFLILGKLKYDYIVDDRTIGLEELNDKI